VSVAGVENPWACRTCGADNAPEHCMGEADEQAGWSEEFPRCAIYSIGICTCGCEDCNPSVCISCGEEL
jgi:hypothetical protein